VHFYTTHKQHLEFRKMPSAVLENTAPQVAFRTLRHLPDVADFTLNPDVQRFLACVAPAGARYLSTQRYMQEGDTAAKIMLHAFFSGQIVRNCAAEAYMCQGTVPMLANELRYLDRVRFLWGSAQDRSRPYPRIAKRQRSDGVD
jgi:hypothetical protein